MISSLRSHFSDLLFRNARQTDCANVMMSLKFAKNIKVKCSEFFAFQGFFLSITKVDNEIGLNITSLQILELELGFRDIACKELRLLALIT